jgi:hypothetical protein
MKEHILCSNMESFGPVTLQKNGLILYFNKGFIGQFMDGGGGDTGGGNSPPRLKQSAGCSRAAFK